MLTNNNDTAKKIKIFDENYPFSGNFDRIKQNEQSLFYKRQTCM